MRLHRRFLPWLFFHFIEFWYHYLGAFLCLYLLHYFQSQIPQLAKDLGDYVSQGSIEQVNLFQFLWLAVAILIFRTFSRLLFFYPARVQQKYLRHEMMYRLESAHPGLYKHFSDGDIFQTIYNDINRLRGLVGFGLLQVGNIIIAVWIFYPKIQQFNESFLIAFSPLVFGMVIFTIITYFFQPLMRKDMDMMAIVQNFLIESYDAKKTIKNFHSESSFIELFRHHSYAELRYFFLSGIGKTFGIPLVRLAFGLSLLWAALIVKEQGLSGSSLIFFSGFLFLILEPLMFLSWIGVVMSQGFAAWGRVKDLMNATMQTHDLTWAKRSSAFSPQIALWGKDINLHFHPNKWNVIVGDTGVGKSYLLEKMCEVFYAHKYKYSFIHQEPYLYNDSIEANIFLGLEKSAEKKALVKKYCEAFGLTVLASNLDDLLKMEVGENGKKLSGGQQKRVALIRSLVADVDIILWDDPFSSVDFILEKKILDLLQADENLKSKTFIITSHRISTIKFCDEVVMINKEGVVEEGAVKELFSSGSIIREYFEKQLV